MPHMHGMGFPPPVQGSPPPTIDLTDGSHKPGSQDCVTDQSKPTKRRRVAKKKIEVVELDDTKEDAELMKHVGPWKDHWVIQLIAVRGEMQNIFSAPPKQGNFSTNVCMCLWFFFLVFSWAYTCHMLSMSLLFYVATFFCFCYAVSADCRVCHSPGSLQAPLLPGLPFFLVSAGLCSADRTAAGPFLPL